MRIADRFLPRNESVAKWVLFVLTLVSAGVTLVFAVFLPSQQTRAETGATVTGCVLILAVAIALTAMQHPPAWLWAVYPFLAAVLMTVLDLTSHDSSVTAQVFFFFPVLYAGAQLKRFA